jgi:uncharacterized protein YbaP (TraB family)
MINRKRALSLFITFLILLNALSVYGKDIISQRKIFLWKASSSHSTVYLLGSLHFAQKDLYPLDSTIENAYDSSDILVVEININTLNNAEIHHAMINRARYNNNETLKNHVSQETYELTEKAFAQAGIPLTDVHIFKPWFCALTLTTLKLQQIGYEPTYGIDYYFLKKAEHDNKKIVELESLKEQVDLFDNFSEKEQELFLFYTIKELTEIEKETDKLFRAWKSGDNKTIESLLTESFIKYPKLKPLYKKLYLERNIKMSAQIKEFLRSSKTYFVVVGAGHLVGKDGLVEMLKKAGYRVHQMGKAVVSSGIRGTERHLFYETGSY